MSSTFEKQLRKYARLTIEAGVAASPERELIVVADVADAPFARLLVEEAYKAGTTSVFVNYVDDQVTLLRYAHGTQAALENAPRWFFDGIADRIFEGASYLRVFGTDPALLKDVEKAKINLASAATARASEKIGEAVTGKTKGGFCIVAHASPGWAKAVFPDLPVDQAVARLWEKIFSCSHVDSDDPVKSWNQHCDNLERKRDELNARRYTALHLTGGGTDLKIGLAENSQFAGGRQQRGSGPKFSPNIPTEEVFTMPHKDRVDGVVRSSMPLSLRGTIIDGIEMVFEKGLVAKASAAQGEEVLLGLLNTDEGARRLGEVALVPNSSRVSQAKTLFFNTLYDENAACHIALGKAIGENMADYDDLSKEELAARGVNDSLIHVDWMIGSAETNVDGIDASGKSEPLMRNGEWV